MINNTSNIERLGKNSTTLQTFPKHIPLKTAYGESQYTSMIDKIKRGFGLCPLV
jgi:hypothetical protein